LISPQGLLWFAIMLGIMVLVHELGHFWAAISVGIKVETFSIGFGTRLFGFRRGETDFRVSAIPLGGYVRMLGEQPGDEKASDPRSFQAKSRWQRAIVIIAGPLMNVVLAVAIMTGLYMYGVPTEVQSKAVVGSIMPGSPAAQAGVQPADRIVAFDGQKDPSWADVEMKTSMSANHPVHVSLDRSGKTLNVELTPRMDPKSGMGTAGWRGGVQIGQVSTGMPASAAGLRPGDLFLKVDGKMVTSPEMVRNAIINSRGRPVDFEIQRAGQVQHVSVAPKAVNVPGTPYQIGVAFAYRVQNEKYSFVPALGASLRFNKSNALLIYRMLGSLIERRISPKAALAGPIGMAQASTEAAKEGPLDFLFFMALISLNLAVFNLLPIPILDGGTLLMLIVEMLLQREVSLQVKETIVKIGFVCLMAIVVFAIYNDISRMLTNG
jgi:regulator of sigma E protease